MIVKPESTVLVVAGPLTAALERGALRSIRMGDRDLLTGIYAAVRDRGWVTVEPVFSRYHVNRGNDGFEVSLNAACTRAADGTDISWAGAIVGRPDGSISFSFDAIVRRPFLRARIGLCVLHPLRLAGTPLAVETPWGVLRGRFPSLITAHLPFSNVTGIRQDLRKTSEIEIRFEGDLFQMEDQRAFTDASFKTFSTPLELPWPVMVEAGTRIHQAVHVRTVARSRVPGAATRARRRRAHAQAIEVGGAHAPRPRIGTELPPPEVEVDGVVDALRALRLDYLRAVVDGSDPGPDIKRAADLAARLGLPVALGIVARAGDGGVARALRIVVASGMHLDRVSAFDTLRHTTPAPLLGDLRDALRREGLDVAAGGGSRGYVYQLVLDGVPPDVGFVEYPVNPQVHARDGRSILESVASLPATVTTARELGGNAPVHVAPASMRPLFNPDLIDGEAEPGPGELPSRYDHRQADGLPAVWTLETLAGLTSEGVSSVSVHEAAGWGGLIAASHGALPPMPLGTGSTLPVGRVVAAVTELTHARVCATSGSPTVAILALEHDQGWRILVASREPAACRLVLELPGASTRIAASSLDVGLVPWRPMDIVVRRRAALSLDLPAWSLGRIDVS